ncbi:unnamed protein product [Dibothriocephalus latus]|uniref:Uncharacterized protein n=1 Tax=Dibothriocephalus latus TaxID=60516 RepID=A0A3P7LQ58_DIBLA|nr:unnamed protein product [Dibothriocephalus latus]
MKTTSTYGKKTTIFNQRSTTQMHHTNQLTKTSLARKKLKQPSLIRTSSEIAHLRRVHIFCPNVPSQFPCKLPPSKFPPSCLLS